MKKWISLFLAGLALMGCSGGGGSGGGGTGSTSLIQTSKMSCNGSVCMGDGSLSLMGLGGSVRSLNVTTAVGLYNTFNQTVIPALNGLISKIEEGVANGGAESCADISTSFNGTVTAGGVSYDAQTAVSSATADGTFFSTVNMTKHLAARLSGGSNFLTADIDCGAGSDASPLVARVVSTDGTNQLNIWFERGSSAHVRILIVAKYSGTNYAGWFKTDDGNSYDFVFSSGGVVYQGRGNKSANWVYYKDSSPTGPTCLNATDGTAGSGCTTTFPTPPAIGTDLVTSAINNSSWATVNAATLVTPSYP